MLKKRMMKKYMVKNNFETMFSGLEKGVFNNQKKLMNDSVVKIYYGVTRDGFDRLSFLSSVQPPKIDSTKMLRVVQGEEGKGNYWTCFDLLNREFEQIFFMFCDDITNSIQELNSELAELNTIKERFSVWKIMFKKVNSSLSLEKEQGLFGELYFLDKYMIPRYGVNNSINAWSGPLGYNKDFSIGKTWYEIKTISVNSTCVKISSLSQLSSDVAGKLSIIRIEKMSEEYNDGICSIFDVFNDILKQIKDNELQEKFIGKVLEYGFNPEIDFQKNKFNILNISIYNVDDQFPRLTERDIKFQEINNVTYDIIVNTIEKYKVEEL